MPNGMSEEEEILKVYPRIQKNIYRIATRTDQTVFDLLVCPLDRGDNRDDRCDSDDDSEHGQKGTHLVRPDALKGQSYIFKQLFFLLYECDGARVSKFKKPFMLA